MYFPTVSGTGASTARGGDSERVEERLGALKLDLRREKGREADSGVDIISNAVHHEYTWRFD